MTLHQKEKLSGFFTFFLCCCILLPFSVMFFAMGFGLDSGKIQFNSGMYSIILFLGLTAPIIIGLGIINRSLKLYTILKFMSIFYLTLLLLMLWKLSYLGGDIQPDRRTISSGSSYNISK